MQLSLRRPVQSLCIFCAPCQAAWSSTPCLYQSSTASSRRNASFSTRHVERDRTFRRVRPPATFDPDDEYGRQPRRPRGSPSGRPAGESAIDRLANREQLDSTRIRGVGKDLRRGSVSFFSNDKNKTIDRNIRHILASMQTSIQDDKILARLQLAEEDLRSRFEDFVDKLDAQIKSRDKNNTLLSKLRESVENRKKVELDVKMAFFSETIMARFTEQDFRRQEKMANMQYPQEWYPATRMRTRELHLHVGPTNSGKTYQALKRLEEAESGIYAGPLRLLAHEVYMRLNARGQRCNLLTGDEQKTADDDPIAPMTSCTVEMMALNTPLDVAVIDEIQLIGSAERGWAWTQAVLGVQAKEVHMCGEERAIPIVRELAALCGDKLHVHHYKRLSPLKMMSRSLAGNVENLKKGDCVVCFSVMAIHGLRQLIEKTLNVKVAIIYGSLPPETRAQQARLFNDPNNDYDILVASDAVGMGLNLSIKRMIFQSSHKVIAGIPAQLQVHEVKQIAGRAGRYSTAEQDMKTSVPASPTALVEAEPPMSSDVSMKSPLALPEEAPAPERVKSLGLVTTLDKYDLSIITRAMSSEPTPITSAGVFPSDDIVGRFVRYFPHGTPFSFLLTRLHQLAATNSRFHICDVNQRTMIADAIEEIEELTPDERLTMCNSPADPRKPGEMDLIQAYGKLIAGRTGTGILDVQQLNLDLLGEKWKATRPYLKEIEGLHKGVVLWMWLSYRFPAIFIDRELAMHVKEMTEKRIEDTLAKLSVDFSIIQKSRQQAILDMLKSQESEKIPAAAGAGGEAGEDSVGGSEPSMMGDGEVSVRTSMGNGDQAERNRKAVAEKRPLLIIEDDTVAPLKGIRAESRG